MLYDRHIAPCLVYVMQVIIIPRALRILGKYSSNQATWNKGWLFWLVLTKICQTFPIFLTTPGKCSHSFSEPIFFWINVIAFRNCNNDTDIYNSSRAYSMLTTVLRKWPLLPLVVTMILLYPITVPTLQMRRLRLRDGPRHPPPPPAMAKYSW